MDIKTPNSTVHIGEIAAKGINRLISGYDKEQIVMIADENTINLHPYLLKAVPYLEDCEIIQIQSGEEYKTIEMVASIWISLTQMNFRRNALIINLGGGVITDMGGFIASTYKRGIDFINIPTTLLAMVDASVGGKTGIDLANFKNQIGVFNEPQAVFCDSAFLESLPKRQLISGYAEVLKHGLIRSEEYWLKSIEKPVFKQDWNYIITESVKIKNDIVTNDPEEKGERKLLNFGHTIGHAIESFLLESERKILHGEAIAAGMICESFLSHQKRDLPQAQLKEITESINSLFKTG